MLRKYYFEALKEASKNNIPQLANKIKKMDKIIEKEDKIKKPYRLIKWIIIHGFIFFFINNN